MVFARYSFPNPNNGDRYDLSQKELMQLLDKVYQAGWDHAREVFDPALQPVLTTSASFESRDNNTKWNFDNFDEIKFIYKKEIYNE